MTPYLLAYDLRKEENSSDYKTLKDELIRWNAHKVQLSMWMVASSSSAEVVHDYFRAYLDSDDSLFVTEITREMKGSGVLPGSVDWINSNPPRR